MRGKCNYSLLIIHVSALTILGVCSGGFDKIGEVKGRA